MRKIDDAIATAIAKKRNFVQTKHNDSIFINK